MPRSAATSILGQDLPAKQEKAGEAPDPFKPLSATQAIKVVDAVIERFPPEVGDCFGLGTELGLYEGQVIWTARKELLCWWLTPEETYLERRRQFNEIRERIKRLDIVRDVTTSVYIEPISSGFINNKTYDVTALMGERWRVAFYPAIRG